jgi:hypothetical protein
VRCSEDEESLVERVGAQRGGSLAVGSPAGVVSWRYSTVAGTTLGGGLRTTGADGATNRGGVLTASNGLLSVAF